jgi:hypothetical protein
LILCGCRAAAARQVEKEQKDEEAEVDMKSAVLAEAKKQAEKVVVITEDAMRAKSRSQGAGKLWAKAHQEHIRPSAAEVMKDLMSIGLKSLQDVERETQIAGGDAEQAAEKALAAIRAMSSAR